MFSRFSEIIDNRHEHANTLENKKTRKYSGICAATCRKKLFMRPVEFR